MPRTLFINLPVTDLDAAKDFYTALGFTIDPRMTDGTAACMVLSDVIHVMLLTHDKWRGFTTRPIAPSGSSEVALCISCESRDEVNHLTDTAGAHGGTADVNPPQEHGFMFGRSFTDPDGHVWEPMWMDPAVFEGAGPIEAEQAARAG